ncbi:MFS transporter [Fructilactobacillus sanfranciscensis]|uniref:Major facilitator superfamily (MFS) profile domain-containing protein n=1 Tax=Fructilactobacillus sanfranciscensis TaxID=1625 RepID=A0A5C4TJH5_FRUSA|nr:MFS transporter [Fructilactobacillus sanfranciscensis]TNK90090.1 hypothetical protein DID87_05455 [Fructilactobacillus sanfranciscensis]
MTLKNKLAILATALLSFCGVLLETSMNVTFPELSKIFSVSLDKVQWITTGYLLVVTITMSTTAFLLKKYPIKNLFLLATTFFIIGDFLSMIAPNFNLLLLGRLIQAGATGISMPMMYHVIFTTVPRQKIGTYVGICSMVISMAPALGPTYGGGITSPISGMIYNRFGPFKPILSGVCLICLAMLLFNITESWTTSLSITLMFTLLRFGINLTFPNTISNAQANAPMSQTADISSIFNMFQQYGGSLGTTILASVIAFHQNQATSPLEFKQKTQVGGNLDYLLLLILATIVAAATFYNWNFQSRKQATNENQ